MNKVVRLQIDMTYSADEKAIAEIEKKDQAFLSYIEDMFHSWDENDNEPRTPLNIEVRYHIGDQKEEEE